MEISDKGKPMYINFQAEAEQSLSWCTRQRPGSMVLGEAFPPKSLQEGPGRGYSDQVGTAAGMLFSGHLPALDEIQGLCLLPILNLEETEESEEME